MAGMRLAGGLRLVLVLAALASTAAQSKNFMTLTYTYGPDILTTRTPYRPAHISNALSYVNQGLLLLGGATPDTNPTVGQPYQAYWVFTNSATPATIAAFMANDSYYQNNLIKSYRITNLTVPNVNNPATNASSLINPAVDTATNTQQTYSLTAAASPVKTFLALFYTYGNDIGTTRTPYRAAHLANANAYVNAGLLVVGGAYPPTDGFLPYPYGAWFLFNQNANASTVLQFVANDPYVQNNLVVSWFWRNWSVPIISPAVDAATVSMFSPPPPSPPPKPPLPPPSPPVLPPPPPPPTTTSSAMKSHTVGIFTVALSLAAAIAA